MSIALDGIGPIDRAAQDFDERDESIALLLERIGVGDIDSDGLLGERGDVAPARDDDERPSAECSSTKGDPDQPTSTCPDITCVRVPGAAPVATSLGVTLAWVTSSEE